MSDVVDQAVANPSAVKSTFERHRFLVMVFGAVGISFILVLIAMHFYVSSTAIELDLSRPAYQSVREQANRDTQTASFPSTGKIDDAAVQQFRTMYTDQYDKAVGVDGFDSKAMSDQALELPDIK